jgi:hypothetical protein
MSLFHILQNIPFVSVLSISLCWNVSSNVLWKSHKKDTYFTVTQLHVSLLVITTEEVRLGL